MLHLALYGVGFQQRIQIDTLTAHYLMTAECDALNHLSRARAWSTILSYV
jgi:hypothetical protein